MADTKRYPSSDELDYQRRQESGEVPARISTTGEPVTVHAPYAVEDNDTSAYVGVNPEYMTYANDTEKPLRAEGGVEGDREAAVFDSPPAVGLPSPNSTDEDTATAGSGASSDLVYTATSGEGYTATKVEPKAEEPAPVEPPPPVQPPSDEQPVVKATARKS